jgi:hypothetical protein
MSVCTHEFRPEYPGYEYCVCGSHKAHHVTPSKPIELYTRVNHWKPKADAVPVSKNRKPRGQR